jgi:starch phosphorylase
MAYLAIRGCGAVSGVSKLHGTVSRHIFQPLFPNWPQVEVPVGYVTNGVHVPTWDSAPADSLWTGACGKDRWLGSAADLEQDIRRLSDTELWQFRASGRESLVEYARKRLSQQLAGSGSAPQSVESAKRLFDPQVLTLGFARRFATYKRPDLLLHDPQRLLRILTNAQHPVQLIIAGKAHPADRAGQDLIQKWIRFIRQPETRPHAIFLGDYDMLLTEHLVQGVDVWINTPRRPWEACGTSGMKVLVNGGINLSELDGWWAEAYAPEVGWALGDGQEHGDDPAWDAAEAEALYSLLEREVIPEFYNRGKDGVPVAWIARMRESMARLTPRFSANRAVCEYVEQHYIPASVAYRARAADKGAGGKALTDWQRSLEERWAQVRIGDVQVKTDGDRHLFEVQVFTPELDPKSVQVEIYADGMNAGPAVRQELSRGRQIDGAGYLYEGAVPSTRAATDYTVRVIPRFDGAAVPLEASQILWQRR